MADTMATDFRSDSVGPTTCIQVLPFQCKMMPASPTIHPSLAEVMSTEWSELVRGLAAFAASETGAEDQVLPFQCRMTPPSPTAQPSVVETIATESSQPVIGLVT